MIVSEKALETVTLRERSLEIMRTLGQINLDNLKDAVEDTGADSIFWGAQAAHASSDAERAKLRVEIVKAEIGKGRRQQASLGGAKSTERSIEEDIVLEGTYQTAMEAQIVAFEKAGVLNAVRFAIDRKQKTLEGLTGMLVAEMMARNAGKPSSPDAAIRESMRANMAAVPLAKRGRRVAAVEAPSVEVVEVPRRSALTD